MIGHSQGCLIAAMAMPSAKKAILLAPAPQLSIDRLIANFSDRPGVEVNLKGISRLTRRDGSTTLIGPEYVKELTKVNPVQTYNHLTKQTELIIVSADKDEVLGEADYGQIKASKVLHLESNHDFTGVARGQLIELLKKELQ